MPSNPLDRKSRSIFEACLQKLQCGRLVAVRCLSEFLFVRLRVTVLRDLFQGDDDGWLEAPALLDRLVSERLQVKAEAIAAEGWKWTDISVDLPYGYSHGIRRLSGEAVPMSEDEVAIHAAHLAGYRQLEEEHPGQDAVPEGISKRRAALELAMEAPGL